MAFRRAPKVLQSASTACRTHKLSVKKKVELFWQPAGLPQPAELMKCQKKGSSALLADVKKSLKMQ